MNENNDGLIEVDEMETKDIRMRLTVSRATYLENAARCSCPPNGAPLDLTRSLRDASKAWKDAADLCEEYLKDLK